MKIEVLLSFLEDNMPDARMMTKKDNTLVIHTNMRVAEKEDGLHIVPLAEEPPNNIISLLHHPKFLAAHGNNVGEDGPPVLPVHDF